MPPRPHRGPRTAQFQRRRALAPATAPVPPLPLPPGRTITLAERGEFFLRDSGGSGPAVLLVHGWMFPSDLNWIHAYAPLQRGGYRVLALDLRGHGRGLRSSEAFRLTDCADDLAAVLTHLGIGSAVVVGYSLGGAVAQLMARRHPQLVRAVVLCATAMDWSDPRQKVFWHTMAGLRLVLGAFPLGSWRAMIRLTGGQRHDASWVAGELSRGSGRDLAEAGRDLGRFDSRGWAGSLRVPAAVLVMTRDRLVPPDKQRALAAGLGARVFPVDGDHDVCSRAPTRFNAALLSALDSLLQDRAHSA